MKKVATRVAVAQVVIQKHEHWVWAQVSFTAPPGLKVLDSGRESIGLNERKRRFGKMDCFLNEQPVGWAIVNVQ